MYKEIGAMVLVSLLVIMTSAYCAQALQLVLDFHDMTANGLSYIFSTGKIGVLIAKLISYLVAPFFIATIVATFYYLVRRHFMPWFMHVAWAVWLIQATALVLYS